VAGGRRGPFGTLDFNAEEQARLRAAGLADDAAVWDAAGTRPEEPLAHLAAESGIDRARLRSVLAAAGLREVRPARGGVASRHWLDAVLVGAVVLVGWLAVREPPRPAEPRHVRARGVIAAFQVLDASQLADTTAPAPAGVVESLPDAAGRVVLRSVAPGQPIRKRDLGPRLPPGALDGRAVMALSAAPTPPDAQPRPGARVGLLLTPRAPGGTGAVLPDALVLSATRADSALSLLVALPRADLATAAALLGSAKVHVIATPP
jgi:hypothetical protein